MNHKTILLHGYALVIAGFVFNFLETWYFGWNWKPSCRLEMICDYAASAAMIAGMMIILWEGSDK